MKFSPYNQCCPNNVSGSRKKILKAINPQLLATFTQNPLKSFSSFSAKNAEKASQKFV